MGDITKYGSIASFDIAHPPTPSCHDFVARDYCECVCWGALALVSPSCRSWRWQRQHRLFGMSPTQKIKPHCLHNPIIRQAPPIAALHAPSNASTIGLAGFRSIPSNRIDCNEPYPKPPR